MLDSKSTETAQRCLNDGFKIIVFLTEIWLNLQPTNQPTNQPTSDILKSQ